MRNPKEISKKIISLIHENDQSELESKIEKLLEKEADPSVPRCNQCTKTLETDKKGRLRDREAVEVSVRWGYNSFAKDTDYDNWRLCGVCASKLLEKTSLTCSFCKKTIVEVMAELAAQNSGCSFFGDYQAALAYQKSAPFGLEYATIKDHIICEWCYDKITAEFAIQIPGESYDIITGVSYPDSNRPRINRIAQGLKFFAEADFSDFTRNIYRSTLPYKEVMEIKKLANPEKNITLVEVIIYKKDFLHAVFNKSYLHSYKDEIRFKTGDESSHTIAYYSDTDAIKNFCPGGDVTKPQILEGGKIVAFGGIRFSVDSLRHLAEMSENSFNSNDVH